MAGPEFLFDGHAQARATVLLAHGAGAAMDTPFMNTIAQGMAARGFRVARFEFAYMAGRRSGGPKRPPPKMPVLEAEYRAAIDALACTGPLVIGGKSMGGRVASLIADDLFASGRVGGLLCLGYPFHPPAKPDNLRTGHLATLRIPTLICQGTRDPFGTRADIGRYDLSNSIALHWLEDGDHDLKPRKKVTGKSHDDHLAATCEAVVSWLEMIASSND